MTNILVIGLKLDLRRRSRKFIWFLYGFELFGFAGLAVFAMDNLCGGPMTDLYMKMVDAEPFRRFRLFGIAVNRMSCIYYPEWWPLLFTSPLLAFAVFGGFVSLSYAILSRKFQQ